MKSQIRKNRILSLTMVFSMMLLMVFPTAVFAEGELPPEEGAEVPAEEAPVEEVIIEEELPAPQVTVVSVSEVKKPCEKQEEVAEIVEALNDADLVIVDDSGEAISMASQEAVETLSADSDPFYFDSSLSAWVGYSETGVCANRVNPVNCHTTTTPVQDAVDGAIAAGATDIYVVTGVSKTFNEDLTLSAATTGFTLYAIKNAWDAEGVKSSGVPTGYATLNSISMSSDAVLLNMFAPLVFVNPGASIQDGIDAATDGGTVNVAEGTFTENIVIGKPLELAGAGQYKTKIHPSTSGPKPGTYGSMPAGSSNMVLVQADDVTIHDLTLDGDNPALTSAVIRDGADIDARNGIISNYNLGSFDNLVVFNTTVKNIYLRGIYAASGGTFDIHDNIVENVKGDYASIAMMNFGGSGIFANNFVNNANDGIVSNWSTGTQYIGNHVTNAGTGIHSDNNGTVGDLIQGNLIEDCSWGIFTFVPYVPITVDGNIVLRSDVGLTAASAANASGSTTFTNNIVDGENKVGSIGGYVTTEAWYYFYRDVNANFYNNEFLNTDYGMVFENFQSPYTGGFDGSSNIYSELKENIFVGSNVALVDSTADTNSNVITAIYNYWGEDNDTIFSSMIFGNVTYDPWLLDHDGDRVFLASDGASAYSDNCPDDFNPNQADTDGDGLGDVCDPTPNGDNDGDGIDNLVDNCINTYNPGQENYDGDSMGDACDPTPNGDTDKDGVDNSVDNCIHTPNPGQTDSDKDGIGDACDPTPDGPGQFGAGTGFGPRSRFGQLIPVTGGDKVDIPCDEECVAFELADGTMIQFCGLCGYSASLSEETVETIPFDMPEGVEMLLGLTINLFDKNGDLVEKVPDGASITVSLPMGTKAESALGMQLWDAEKEEWVQLIDAKAVEGQLDAEIDWLGTILLVE